ncbi:hypothetical protein [Paenibacillus planticolens]|uniref:Uncharacterized protein n=1 Tax=Paenibacillus planticolens TaxID=2654976 RepID=A0ABX1ZEG6_9BACL|nr:hypothetical protein [Paenibacillus planticolens]NOU98493.1 hypothetical protein [Paenibacillus planticolens]
MATTTPKLGLPRPTSSDNVTLANQQALIDAIDNGAAKVAHTHDGMAGNGAQITAAGLASGAATDTVIGNRTADQSQAPSGSSGTITQLFSWITNRIKAITGSANWYDAPPTTLTAANTHMTATTGVHGATSAATANALITRDTNGRAQVAAPAAAADIARKDTVDAVAAVANAALPATSYTAADVLAKVKSLGGAGSGLDADLFDGLDSVAFWKTSQLRVVNAGAPTARLQYFDAGVWKEVGNLFDKTAMTQFQNPATSNLVALSATYSTLYSYTGKGYLDYAYLMSDSSVEVGIRITVDGVLKFEGKVAAATTAAMAGVMQRNQFMVSSPNNGNPNPYIASNNNSGGAIHNLKLGPGWSGGNTINHVDYPYTANASVGSKGHIAILNDSIYFASSILIEAKATSGSTTATAYNYAGGKI